MVQRGEGRMLRLNVLAARSGWGLARRRLSAKTPQNGGLGWGITNTGRSDVRAKPRPLFLTDVIRWVDEPGRKKRV